MVAFNNLHMRFCNNDYKLDNVIIMRSEISSLIFVCTDNGHTQEQITAVDKSLHFSNHVHLSVV